jgi:hypothetical protein
MQKKNNTKHDSSDKGRVGTESVASATSVPAKRKFRRLLPSSPSADHHLIDRSNTVSV